MGRRRAVRGPIPDGVLLVDKPAGPTSAALVDWVRWAFGGAPVGHCGTLDPAATGLVVIVVGRGTKLAAHLTEGDKTYRATFVLGRATDTADADGETIATSRPTAADVARAVAIIESLEGTHHLEPPAFSAVSIDGRRAHAMARAGETVELRPRAMVVRAALDVVPGDTSVAVTLQVSKGTYIRSLAEAVGATVGHPCHLGALRRLGSGALRLDDPRTVAGLSVAPLPGRPGAKPRHRIRWPEAPQDRDGQVSALTRRLVPLVDAVTMPVVAPAGDARGADVLRRLGQGQAVDAGAAGWPALPDAGAFAVSGPGGALLLVERQGDRVVPRRAIVPPGATGGMTG